MQDKFDPDQLPDDEKVKLAISALQAFCDQFGPNDIYKQIFLETLFEELMNEPFYIPAPPGPQGR